MSEDETGLRSGELQRPLTELIPGLTNYGDKGFSIFLRKAFIKGAGYSDDALDRRIVGIVNTNVSFCSVEFP